MQYEKMCEDVAGDLVVDLKWLLDQRLLSSWEVILVAVGMKSAYERRRGSWGLCSKKNRFPYCVLGRKKAIYTYLFLIKFLVV